MRDTASNLGRFGKRLGYRQRTPFFGRQTEQAQIRSRLLDENCRLLTLTGPGGIGKTRLAIHTAAAISHHFVDGVYFIDLQPLQAAEAILIAVYEALDLPHGPHRNPVDFLLTELAERQILFIFDNFEHLLDGVEFVDELLASLPKVKILATSRTVLNLQDEWHFPLRGLELPADTPHSNGVGKLADPADHLTAADAIRLFFHCAVRANPNFAIEKEFEHVVHICKLVDGMPLAIELAATWTRTLDCEQIAAEIQRGSQTLATQMRNVPLRHQSIQTLFDQTWQALTPTQQAAYLALSVFPATFNRAAAQAVAGASLQTIAGLIDHSLLHLSAGNRYSTHSLLRQFAHQQLAADPQRFAQTQIALIRYYGALLTRLFPALRGQDQLGGMREINEELENIRVAAGWVLQHGTVADIHQYAPALGLYFFMSSRYSESATFFSQAIARIRTEVENQTSTETDIRLVECFIICLLDYAYVQFRLGLFDSAEAAATEARTLYRAIGETRLEGEGMDPALILSMLELNRGNYTLCNRHLEEAYARSLAQNQLSNHSISCNMIAFNALVHRDLTRAENFARRGIGSTEKTGNGWYRAVIFITMGQIAGALNNLEEAERYFEQARQIRQDFNDQEGIAYSLANLGEVALQRRELEHADALFVESLQVFQSVQMPSGVAYANLGIAKAALATGSHERARRHLNAGFEAANKFGGIPTLLGLLNISARYLLALGEEHEAATLFQLVTQHAGSRAVFRRVAEENFQMLREKLADSWQPSATIPDLNQCLERTLAKLAQESPHLPKDNHTPHNLALGPQMNGPNGKPLAGHSQETLIEPLTPRELEVLTLIGQGLSNAQIAETLVLSLGTVKFYTTQIYGKMGVRSRVQAINRGHMLGLIHQSPIIAA